MNKLLMVQSVKASKFIPLVHHIMKLDFGVQYVLFSLLIIVELGIMVRMYRNNVIEVITTMARERVGLVLVSSKK